MNNNREAIIINKEIRDYTESVFMGMNLRQCIFGALACIVAVGIYLLLQPSLGIEITSWLCILGASPFAALGFITFQGLNAEQFIIELWRSFLMSRNPLVDIPTNIYYTLMQDSINNQREGGKQNAKKLRKNKETKK